MAREKFPHTLYYFSATIGGSSAGYSGVIEPNWTPMTQAQYEKQAKKQLDHYRKLESVTELVVVEFRLGSSHLEERINGKMVTTWNSFQLGDYLSRGGR